MDGNGKMYYPSNQVAEGVWAKNHNKALVTIKNDESAAGIIREIKARHLAGHSGDHSGIVRRDNSYGYVDHKSSVSDSYISSQPPVAPYK